MTILEYFMSDALMQAIGQSLLHSLWQGLLIVGLLSLVWRYLRDASAASRYFVATLSLFLFFGIVVATFIGIYNKLSTSEIAFLLGDGNAFGVFMDPTVISANELSSKANFPTVLFPFLVSCWFIGVGVMAIRLVLELWYIQRLRLSAWPVESQWRNRIQEYAERLGIRRNVRLLESRWVSSPLTIGFIQPVVLLPIGLINGLTPDQVACILAHEIAHIRRFDFAVNILQSVVEMLLFFNPAVWWISNRIREERELCCDDMAVALTGNQRQLAYTLAKLEEWRMEVPSLAMSFNAPKSKVVERIQRLIGEEPKANVMTKGWLSILLLTAFFVLAAFRISPISEDQVAGAATDLVGDLLLEEELMRVEPVLATLPKSLEHIEEINQPTLALEIEIDNRKRSKWAAPALAPITMDTIPPEKVEELRKRRQELVKKMQALELEMENSPERKEMEALMREFETVHKKFEEKWKSENKELEKELSLLEVRLSEEMRKREAEFSESIEMKQMEEIQRAFEKKAEAIKREFKQNKDLEKNEALQHELQQKMEALHQEFQHQRSDLEQKLQENMKKLNEVQVRLMESKEMKQLQEARAKQHEEFEKLNFELNQKKQTRFQELQQKIQQEYHQKMEKIAEELHEVSRQLEHLHYRYREE